MKSSDPLIQKIGKYAVIDVIGSGGMGIVYRAHDAALNRTVAIKMLKSADAGPGKVHQLEQFFNRELRATASLQHRNIVTVYESGEQDGNPYLVMECLDGEPVSRVINERRAMPIVDKLELFVQVCDGLQHAHDRKPQVIHRDIKPANVILLRDGTAKIVDFGIARVVGIETSTLQAGQLLGSLSYLSPEQINSVPIDARTDIFSAGVMLYELLTYALPFKGNEPAAVFVKILREDPPPLSTYLGEVPPELQACVSKALAKKTHDRYQTAEELGFDLLQIQKRIKQGMAADFMQRAEASMQRGDLERVKLHLQEILRLDRHHDQANRMLAEVRKAIQEQQRSAQIVQMRSQAQVALAGQQYEEALACADQALQLDPADQASMALREEIQKAISLGKAVRDSLRRAESALYAGDFDEAREAVDAALRLDTDSAEARALAEIIDKELSERSRRLQVQGLVDSARQGIAQRLFGDAIESLRKAERLDPGDSNVRELLQWASRGQDQEQRRKDLMDLTDQIHGALRAEDFSSAYTICEVGLGSFPNEPTLQRLKSIAEKQRDIAERRRFVQDQSLAAKELLDHSEFASAIKLLEVALQKLPAEPNLEALLALAKTESERQSEDLESQAAQEASERALLQNQAAQRQAAELRRALDEREQVDHLEGLALQLREMLSGVEFEETTRRSFDPLFEQVRARQLAKEQVAAELLDLLKSVGDSFDPGSRARAKTRLQEVKAEFPHERNVHAACEEVVRALDARGEEHEKTVAELSRIAESVKHVPLNESNDLLRSATRVAAEFSMEPQVGALIQQIEYEVNRRLAQRQALIEEMGQLENASSRARSIIGLSQLISNAHSVASASAGEPEVMAALDRVKSAVEARRQTVSRLLTEINQVADQALMAQGVEQAEQLLAEAQQRAAAHPELDDLQETIGRVSAQVHGRRIEHDLVCEELSSLSASISQALTPADLDAIRNRALQIRDKHAADQAIVALCEQVDAEVRGARAKLLQTELRRLSLDQPVEPANLQLGTTDSASLVEKLQELVKTFPESVELRGMVLRAEDSLERAQRARNEAASRASAIDLEVKASTMLLETRQDAKALSGLEAAVAKYPESAHLQSLLAQCREQIEAEVNRRLAQRQALIEEMGQLENASTRARSISGLSQLISDAHSVASKAAGEPEVMAALDRVKSAAEARRQTISRLLTEINQLADRARVALGVEQAEQLLAEAQQRAAAHPELDDLQETIGRVSAQVHGRRIEHDLVCEELSSLSASLSQALTPVDLDAIRNRALQIRDKHAADQAIVALCEQLDTEFQGARAKLLQIELRRLSLDQPVEPANLQLGTTDSASLVKKLQELVKTFPESVELRGMVLRAEDSLERAQRARNEAASRASAIDLEVKASTMLLETRQDAKALSGLEAAVAKYPESAHLQSLLAQCREQIEAEVNRRLAQRQALIEEMGQLENASTRARSISALSQLISNADSVASAAAGEPDVMAALDRVKSAAEARRQTISRLSTEINQLADRARVALGVEQAEHLLAEAQQRASAHPELDDLQETIGRVSAQVRGRRLEHDLVCEELTSLSESVSQALTPADLDAIRNRALQIRDKHAADQAIVALCEQVDTEVRGARAKLLQIELRRLSQDQPVESATLQMGTTDSSSLVKKLQELVKTFPESVELRGMLLRAEDSLERAQRARNEAAARALAIDLAVKAYTRLLATRPAAKAARAIEEAAAKYPESAQLQSLLLQCREQIEAEEEIKRQASAQRAAMQAAIDKGSDLLRNLRYVEAVAVLEVACQQWPDEKQFEKLLSTAQKSAQKANDRQAVEQAKIRQRELQQAAEQAKIRQRELQVATRTVAAAPRKRLLVPAVVACVLLAMAGLLIRFVTRPHLSVLTVQSNPSGVEIEVDGRTCVTPNCSFKLSPGATYSVKAGLKGYVSSSQSVALSHDQTISFELAQEAPPQPVAVPSPAPSQAPVTAKLVLKGVHSGDQLFVDDVRLAASGRPGTWELTPGSHRLRLMAGNQELIADPRSFKANATVVLNRADFKQPAPATSEEQVAWNRISNTGDPAAVEEFVRRYPNSSFRLQAESKLEALNWAKAGSSGSLRGYQEYAARYTSPPGPHLPAALAEISRLEWEAVQNTTDPLQVKRFLEQNPSGQYHDRGVALLDDLAWREAVRKGDAANLKSYLGSYPSGRHREEATTQLAKLTPPPVAAPAPQATQAPVPVPPPPPATPKVADNAEDLNAIRSVLEGYKSAYDTKDVSKLQELWPDMSPKQVNVLRTAFRDAGKVTLTYAITKGPDVSGNVAVVSFQQQIITNAAAKAQVTMTLKKDGTSWHITSIR